jgi:hypothetical protein
MINTFGSLIKPNTPLAKAGLRTKINRICQVLDNLTGSNGIDISRDGWDWDISYNPGSDSGSDATDFWELLDGAPDYVLGKKAVDPLDLTKGYTYGWVATVTHASQHPEAEET